MHEQVHEVRTNVEEHAGVFTQERSAVDCVDGRCKERDTKAVMAATAAQPRWGDIQAPPNLRGFIHSMMGAFRPTGLRHTMPQAEVVVLDPVPVMGETWRAPKEALAQRLGAPGADGQQLSMNAVVVAASFAGLTALAAAGALLRLLNFSEGVGARELRSNDMAEPLAHADALPLPRVALVAAASCPAATVAAGTTPSTQKAADLEAHQERPFQFKPSVGSWLCHRLHAEANGAA